MFDKLQQLNKKEIQKKKKPPPCSEHHSRKVSFTYRYTIIRNANRKFIQYPGDCPANCN